MAQVEDGAHPRGTKPGSARRALLNALGEFTLGGPDRAPRTGALMQVLVETGIADHAARQAIRRCAQSGWLDSTRDGREARWTLSPLGRELLSDGIAQVEALGRERSRWDGAWLIVIPTIPQTLRTVRERFYRALRWNGFGSPMPGVWISAHVERAPAVAAAVGRCGLAGSTLSFAGPATGIGLSQDEAVARAWDLPLLAERYLGLIRRFRGCEPQSPADALVALLELDEELQAVPLWDPQLPAGLAPGWAGRTSAAELLQLRGRWLGPARRHWHRLQ